MADESAYVDTSILGAYYCPEPLSAAAEKALRQFKTPDISVLSEVEVCSLISKKYRLDELRERHAEEDLDFLPNHGPDRLQRRTSLETEHCVAPRLRGVTMDK